MAEPVITLLSDFGLKDPYVAEMKAVISAISPLTNIIDISHSIDKFDVRMGSFVLASAAPYFPKGTIHLAVVDPGVGTERRPLLVEAKSASYIGPDNGLLMLAAKKDGIKRAYVIRSRKFMLPKVSHTFHGRDIFAPAAAHLANGTPPSQFGPSIENYISPGFARPFLKSGKLHAEVLHVDDFGNIITNVTVQDLKKVGLRPKKMVSIKLKNRMLSMPFCETFGEAPLKAELAQIGSHGFLEIVVNQGSASKKFNARAGNHLIVSLEDSR
jgi:S-adenosylmethionine hydrolase